MPTYEYQCQSCQHDFERYQSFSEDPITLCPECGEEKVQKVISGGAGVVFKGGGFYETDYNRGKGSDYHKKNTDEGGSKTPSTPVDSKETKTDSKPKAEAPKPAAASTSKKAD